MPSSQNHPGFFDLLGDKQPVGFHIEIDPLADLGFEKHLLIANQRIEDHPGLSISKYYISKFIRM